MTFTPQVLTQTDNNNSVASLTDTSFNGISTITTGFNTIILTIESFVDSSAGGIKIQFSDDNINWITPYVDTYFATNIFTKNYLIIKKYYRIQYSSLSSTTFTITSRISTQLDSSITQNTSINVFDNEVENTLDAFGKLRVSNPTTLIDIRFPGQIDGSANFLNNTLQITSDASSNNLTGSNTGTYGNSKLVINMTFSGASSKYYISQSRSYCTYQPGKSLLFLASGIFDPSYSGLTLSNIDDTISSRIGYFDFSVNSLSTYVPVVRNGMYLQINYSGPSTTRIVSFNITNNGSNTSIPQTFWNIDKMDGKGPSGLTLDFTKAQLLTMDMEWLGVGRVRFGFYAYGRIQYCHQVTNINFAGQPYTTSINLPICYSLCGTSVGSNFTGSITQICSTVISEGGYNPSGRPFSIASGNVSGSGIALAKDVETPLLFLRGGSSNYYHQTIIPTGLTISTDDPNRFVIYKLVLFLDGQLPVTPSWQAVNSGVSVAQYSTSYTGTYNSNNGIIIDSGYFYGRTNTTTTNLANIFSSLFVQVNCNVRNIADVLVLTGTFIGTGTAPNSFGTLSWQELY